VDAAAAMLAVAPLLELPCRCGGNPGVATSAGGDQAAGGVAPWGSAATGMRQAAAMLLFLLLVHWARPGLVHGKEEGVMSLDLLLLRLTLLLWWLPPREFGLDLGWGAAVCAG